MVGAVLTQNTAWSNVARAIDNLMRAGLDTPEAVLQESASSLSELLRPAGYFNVKARRLRSLCEWLSDSGGVDTLSGFSTHELRSRLLAIHGVGMETADDILLYALRRPVFVIDAYTRRIFARLGLIEGGESYEQLRGAFEAAMDCEIEKMSEMHALIVRHAKMLCRKRPVCAACVLSDICTFPDTPIALSAPGRSHRSR